MLHSLLQQILVMCLRIMSRLVDAALANTRRFDSIDKKLAALDAKLDAKFEAVDERFHAATLRFDAIDDGLKKILAAVEPLPVAEVLIDVEFEGQFIQGATDMQLKDTQKFDFTLKGVDAKGAPAALDGTKTTVSVDDPTVATVALNADGLSGSVVAGVPGATQMKVTVTDASDATDVKTGALDIEVLAGSVATVQIGTSAPVEVEPAA